MKLENVSIGYYSSRSNTKKTAPLVSAIDAELLSGDFVCLIGRNGCGKSTLLKTIAGLLPPLSGNITYDLTQEHVGIVLTEFPRLQNTTVFELVSYGRLPNLNLFAKLKQEDVDAVNNALATVGISEMRNKRTCELSDGEKQKTMIARVLAQGTNILLLDEPSAFLDYISKHELMKMLKSLAKKSGKAILLSTHDIDMVKNYADRIWVIDNRHLIVKDSL